LTTVTKRREGDAQNGPRYRVLINGEPSRLVIERGPAPKYGHPQLWEVIEPEQDAWLFDAKGLADALEIIRAIREA
jgi:hypothetical protein